MVSWAATGPDCRPETRTDTGKITPRLPKRARRVIGRLFVRGVDIADNLRSRCDGRAIAGRQPHPPVFPNLSLELDEVRRAGGGNALISRERAVHGPSTPAGRTAGHGATLLPCSLDSDRLRRFRRSWRNAHAGRCSTAASGTRASRPPRRPHSVAKGSRRLPKAVDGGHVVASPGEEVAEGSRRLPKTVDGGHVVASTGEEVAEGSRRPEGSLTTGRVSRTAPDPHVTTRHRSQSNRGQGEPHGTAPARHHPGTDRPEPRPVVDCA